MSIAITADFKTAPYIHQLREFELFAEEPNRALFWQMRTGKTKVIIDTACHLFTEDKIDAVVVFAPNGVHANWVQRELPIHHWDTIDQSALIWDTAAASDAPAKGVRRMGKEKFELWEASHAAFWGKARAMIKAPRRQGLMWFAFSSATVQRDDVKKILNTLRSKKRVMVVYDESHDYRTAGSKRTTRARAFSKHCPYTRILTGTPVTNSPLHAYAQFQILKEGSLGYTDFDSFKEHFAEYEEKRSRGGRKYPDLVGYKNLDELRELMAPYSSVLLREDCEDLPDLVVRNHEFEMTPEQRELYVRMHTEFEFDIDNKLVTVGENAAKLVKLQQIGSGFLIDEFKDVHDIPGQNRRLDILSDEVYLCPGKAIVWCRFQEDMDRAAARLRADGHEVVEYHGRISDKDKQKAREAMAPGAENDVKALVGFPTPGLDLSSAGAIIWYSHTFDAIARAQADERATAVGGENVQVCNLIGTPTDAYILETISKNISVADDVAGRGMQEVLERIAA